MSEIPQPNVAKTWPDYRAVWRWHFYAGLFTLPFVIVLSISGAIYLFKPQIEAWSERDYDNLSVTGHPASVSDQVKAALAAIPGSTPSGYELPLTSNSATRVIVRTKEGEAIRVYLHPETLAILHTFPEQERFMRWLFRLHGELLMGDRGSNIVELAASWTIIMIVTGLYLWWPRQAKGWGGIIYPRLRNGSAIFWRDLHSVTGVWISAFALFLLLTGLPWAKFWGNYFKAVRRTTGTAVAQQDWTTGSERPLGSKKESTSSGEHSGHGGGKRSGGRRGGSGVMPKDMTAFDRIAATVIPLKLEHPVVIAPPTSADSDDWTAKSMTANRPYRVNLVVSGQSGEIISREDFNDRHIIDRVVSIGIAAHEGQLFGWPNQLLGLLTAIGLVLLSVSGVVMWWRRRDRGVLGAPKALLNPRLSFGLVVLVILFGIYLPLFGASLILVLMAEFAVLKRIPKVRDWLGLTIILVMLPGCGGVKPVTGGTDGVLHAGSAMLSDIQVTVHQVEGHTSKPIGFGIAKTDGTFQLVMNEAKGPLTLAPGEYRCTLESVGAPVVIPKEFTMPATTPLKITWPTSDRKLDLDIPPPKPSR